MHESSVINTAPAIASIEPDNPHEPKNCSTSFPDANPDPTVYETKAPATTSSVAMLTLFFFSILLNFPFKFCAASCGTLHHKSAGLSHTGLKTVWDSRIRLFHIVADFFQKLSHFCSHGITWLSQRLSYDSARKSQAVKACFYRTRIWLFFHKVIERSKFCV